ncbi:hypothetical protein GY45DRAFT_1326624 [Cubamyces sp. BRFM 1775]|nr:hypothetical protein GY45DRAFT_1326624 [Cubamyces sp. BRFM 1775]
MTSATADGYVYVDDNDPSVIFSGGWDVSTTPYAWHHSLHAAQGAGLTATFTFTGTWISVVGGGGDTNTFGWPSTSYVIDGKNYGILNTGSDASPDTYFDNVTMFTSPTLPAGKHTLVITNLNGTKPNTFWLDYFWYLPSDDPSTSTHTSAATTAGDTQPTNHPASSHSTTASHTSASSTSTSANHEESISVTSTSSSAASGSSSSTSLAQLPSSLTPSSAPSGASAQALGSAGAAQSSLSAAALPSPTATAGNDASASVSGHSQNLSAIIGGAVGGAVLLALLAILGVYFYLKYRLGARPGHNALEKIHRDPNGGALLPTATTPDTISFTPGSSSSGPASDWSGQQPGSAALLLPNSESASEEPSSSSRMGIFRIRSMRKDRNLVSPSAASPPIEALPPPYSAD